MKDNRCSNPAMCHESDRCCFAGQGDPTGACVDVWPWVFDSGAEVSEEEVRNAGEAFRAAIAKARKGTA